MQFEGLKKIRAASLPVSGVIWHNVNRFSTFGRSETMLRVTISIDEVGPVIRLEGRLTGSAIQEAQRGWQETCAEHPERPFRVDVRGVTFIDEEGKSFLQKVFDEGASFLSSGCLTRAVIHEIMRTGRNSQENLKKEEPKEEKAQERRSR
jgi:anti-anti-sigma regulatory factor